MSDIAIYHQPPMSGAKIRVPEQRGEAPAHYMTTVLLLYSTVLGSLVTMLLGWIKWFRGPQESGIFPKLSFVGMCLTSATIFGLVAFAIYAEMFGVRSSVHYELLIGIYKFMAPLCVLGFLCGLVGLWRRSPLRWLAPLCAFFTACVWFIGGVIIDPI